MSVPVLALRPAVDARPPAEAWRAHTISENTVPPSQPPLDLVQDDQPLTLPPVATRMAATIDVIPAGVRPELAADLADEARTWAPWFAQLLTEALDGRRPLEPLGRWLDDWVLAEVARRVRMQRRTQTRSRTATPVPPAAVVSLRAQLTHPRVLEVSAHLRRGPRSHACAFQLVRTGERWRCAALQLN